MVVPEPSVCYGLCSEQKLLSACAYQTDEFGTVTVGFVAGYLRLGKPEPTCYRLEVNFGVLISVCGVVLPLGFATGYLSIT